MQTVIARAIVLQAIRVAGESAVAALGWHGFHASSVVVGGRAILFAAPSGTGKSTLAARCEGAGFVRLADESTLLRNGPDGVEAAAHPAQLVASRLGESFPVACVCLLERGESGYAPVSGAGARRGLLGSLFCHEEGLATAAESLALVGAVASRVPVFRLCVPNDAGAVDVVRTLAAGIPA